MRSCRRCAARSCRGPASMRRNSLHTRASTTCASTSDPSACTRAVPCQQRAQKFRRSCRSASGRGKGCRARRGDGTTSWHSSTWHRACQRWRRSRCACSRPGSGSRHGAFVARVTWATCNKDCLHALCSSMSRIAVKMMQVVCAPSASYRVSQDDVVTANPCLQSAACMCISSVASAMQVSRGTSTSSPPGQPDSTAPRSPARVDLAQRHRLSPPASASEPALQGTILPLALQRASGANAPSGGNTLAPPSRRGLEASAPAQQDTKPSAAPYAQADAAQDVHEAEGAGAAASARQGDAGAAGNRNAPSKPQSPVQSAAAALTADRASADGQNAALRGGVALQRTGTRSAESLLLACGRKALSPMDP